jgi:hypothetical protein
MNLYCSCCIGPGRLPSNHMNTRAVYHWEGLSGCFFLTVACFVYSSFSGGLVY